MTNNVIDFNSVRARKMTEKFDQVTIEMENEESFIADFSITVMRDVIDALTELDYDIMTKPEAVKDLLSCVEALRSLVSRISDIDHPFQAVADSIFDEVFGEEELQEVLESFMEETDYDD
jgi:hypothetical protein